MLETRPSVLIDIDDGIASIILNRPDTLNVLDTQLVSELSASIERCAVAQDIRVLVLRGNGRCFGAGGDINSFRSADTDSRKFVQGHLDEVNLVLKRLRALPAVVLAAVHGAVAGGSMGLMCAADLVIAAEDTRFSTAYARIGATPDAGLTYFLPRLLGERRALELMMLGEVFDATHAKELGLVNFVSAADVFDSKVIELATRLRDGPTRAYRGMKALTYNSLQNDLTEQSQAERRSFVEMMGTADFVEGLAAFLQKRSPRFFGK